MIFTARLFATSPSIYPCNGTMTEIKTKSFRWTTLAQYNQACLSVLSLHKTRRLLKHLLAGLDTADAVLVAASLRPSRISEADACLIHINTPTVDHPRPEPDLAGYARVCGAPFAYLAACNHRIQRWRRTYFERGRALPAFGDFPLMQR